MRDRLNVRAMVGSAHPTPELVYIECSVCVRHLVAGGGVF